MISIYCFVNWDDVAAPLLQKLSLCSVNPSQWSIFFLPLPQM